MLGLFEINGPISATYDENFQTTGAINPFSWSKEANMIYIDNPVGTGTKSDVWSKIFFKKIQPQCRKDRKTS